MKSIMSHQFSQVPRVEIPRSVFNRSHGYKTAFNAGYLIPFYVDEALPGDTFTAKTSIFARLTTPIVPFMDNLFLDTHYFAVPCRLLWEHWQNMMGERETPDDDTEYLTPIIVAPTPNGYGEETIFDYMGLPIGKPEIEHSALPLRAYNAIYNSWFRDQNLIDPVTENKDDGPDLYTDYTLLKRAKRHDYFTSCLPWPQKGDAVVLSLADVAPVIGDGNTMSLQRLSGAYGVGLYQVGGGLLNSGTLVGQPIGTAVGTPTPTTDSVGLGLHEDPTKSGVIADLSQATATTINDLREAFQLQKMLERDARGGTRYTEIIRSHFGVVSPDARMQRPEYLGGSTSRINIHPVQQTSASVDGQTPQGTLAAFGVCTSMDGGFSKSFTEHCIVMGLVSVRADLTYQQGMNRMWSRQTRYDYYWPSLAHLGEQAVYNREIWCSGTGSDDGVFGYQERWAEYRHFPSQITGKLRSDATTSLDVWHLSQDFGSLPTLSQSFIEENPPLSRVLALETEEEPAILMDSYIELKCARPMPTYSVPGLIDHF